MDDSGGAVTALSGLAVGRRSPAGSSILAKSPRRVTRRFGFLPSSRAKLDPKKFGAGVSLRGAGRSARKGAGRADCPANRRALGRAADRMGSSDAKAKLPDPPAPKVELLVPVSVPKAKLPDHPAPKVKLLVPVAAAKPEVRAAPASPAGAPKLGGASLGVAALLEKAMNPATATRATSTSTSPNLGNNHLAIVAAAGPLNAETRATVNHPMSPSRTAVRATAACACAPNAASTSPGTPATLWRRVAMQSNAVGAKVPFLARSKAEPSKFAKHSFITPRLLGTPCDKRAATLSTLLTAALRCPGAWVAHKPPANLHNAA
mmetsp:Transcript_4773/g.13045  ORF Transcript_4773/g.13045 Transcript_4773/m.13045 type:complete len:319 (+) Transcript_4773:440-1396(+)